MAPQKKKRKHNAERTRRAYIIGRYSLVLIALVALAATIVLFLVNTTIIHNDDWTRKGNSSLGVQRTINPLRGDILACDGSILATNLNHYNVRIDFRSPRFRTDWYAAAIDSLADTLAVYYPRRTRQEWHQLLERPLNDSVQNRSRGYMLLTYRMRTTCGYAPSPSSSAAKTAPRRASAPTPCSRATIPTATWPS